VGEGVKTRVGERAWKLIADGRVADARQLMRWRGAMQRLLRGSPPGLEPDVIQSMARIHDSFLIAGGPLGYILRAGLRPRISTSAGHSLDRILPLPLVLPADRTVLHRRCCERQLDTQAQPLTQPSFGDSFGKWLNLVISALNLLHGGGTVGCVSRVPPSAPQARLWCVLAVALDDFCEGILPWPTLAISRRVLHHDRGTSYVPSSGISFPLGLRGGVPTAAAKVDTASMVEALHPKLANQIRNPSSLLLPVSARPAKLRRPHTHLDATYGEYLN
jgi:hypothetical protein